MATVFFRPVTGVFFTVRFFVATFFLVTPFLRVVFPAPLPLGSIFIATVFFPALFFLPVVFFFTIDTFVWFVTSHESLVQLVQTRIDSGQARLGKSTDITITQPHHPSGIRAQTALRHSGTGRNP
ncbi:MAG TPA: hypothetical protein ENI96_15150 [Sedimenticola thiotaurini]|uniref:Uncharacterized protein n=1 Tax=Sedimenticola thiotaurini TaxID=1543721 RepID=A0A831W6Z0_9GAMM|nr:hypothetical protein [Sedimenticola thiotaurini]